MSRKPPRRPHPVTARACVCSVCMRVDACVCPRMCACVRARSRESSRRDLSDAPLCRPDAVAAAIETLRGARKPLVIVGKGCAYARAEAEVRDLIAATALPFLPTPMGKGVVPDDHPNCIAAARSLALQEADVILLLGARLNWILHFGLPPRFRPGACGDVKGFTGCRVPPRSAFVLHWRVRAAVPCVYRCEDHSAGHQRRGDRRERPCNRRAGGRRQVDLQPAGRRCQGDQVYISCVVVVVDNPARQGGACVSRTATAVPWMPTTPPRERVQAKKNEAYIAEKMLDDSTPMSYYRAFKDVAALLPRDCILVCIRVQQLLCAHL